MFSDGAKDIVVNQMHARVPNSSIKRNQWLNLCIDVQSFMNEIFGKAASGASASVSAASNNPGEMTQTTQHIYKCLEQI
jgi:hypothetical protein